MRDYEVGLTALLMICLTIVICVTQINKVQKFELRNGNEKYCCILQGKVAECTDITEWYKERRVEGRYIASPQAKEEKQGRSRETAFY